jgi:citronellol/citronellal dehydrogenase
LHLLQREAATQADVAVVVTGVNDVVDQVPSHRAISAREALANWLRNTQSVQHVAFAPLPPIHHFPGLPQPLRWVAGADARRHNRALERWARTRMDVSSVAMEMPLNPGCDGQPMASTPARRLSLLRGGHRRARGHPRVARPHSRKQTMNGSYSLQGKTLLITGASRGIGLAIAKRAAAEGANIVLLAKTVDPNPRLPGTLASAAAEVVAAGGQALPVQTDIRDEAAVAAAVQAAVAHFGGIDILVNNASAISLTPTAATPMKRFDLMFGVNVRGTFACTQACLPELIKSAKAGRNPHVLNMSPPLSMKEHWFRGHVAYTMAKYGMSECTLGHAGEFRPLGIAVNSLWPRTAIATAALQMIPGVDLNLCRKPEILADAAFFILTSDAKATTGKFFIDDEVLARHGVTDLDRYAVKPGTTEFIPDFFVD